MAITIDELKRNVFPGESGGDYNALYGYANRPGGQFSGVNLTDMTVDQALQFASPSGPYAASVRGQVGRTATPMGAYQVVGTTLRGAKEGLGLTGQERMTPQLQDAIGMWIYQNQGPGAWEAWGGGGGNVRKSSKGTGMGLLDMPAEQPRTLMDRIRSPETVDNLLSWVNSMRTNPDPNIGGMIENRQARRAEADVANRTAQFLRTRGVKGQELADLVESNALSARDAVTMLYQPEDQVKGIEVGGKLVNPATGEIIYDPTGGAEPMLSSDQLTSLNVLRDDATSATAELGVMKDAWTNVSTFYQNPGAVSDRALVIAFAKILDPGSVVRESESAAIANSGALDAGLRSMLLNALTGTGNLPPEIRNEIAMLSRDMYANKIPGAQNRIEMLTETARRSGLPPELVFSGSLASPDPIITSSPIPPPAGGTGGAVTGAPSTFRPAR